MKVLHKNLKKVQIQVDNYLFTELQERLEMQKIKAKVS